MKLYGGIDLHSNNSVIVLLDETNNKMYQRRQGNDLQTILEALVPYQETLHGLAVESTYNWYWLVDGLMDAGYPVHLVNTAADKQYEGLKHGDDHTDARWLAHLLRLGILPQGYIYPQAERPVRDLLRKRGQLVHMRTANLLSIQTLIARNTGGSLMEITSACYPWAQPSLHSERIQNLEANGNAQHNYGMPPHQQTIPETLGRSADNPSPRLDLIVLS